MLAEGLGGNSAAWSRTCGYARNSGLTIPILSSPASGAFFEAWAHSDRGFASALLHLA